MRFLRSLAVLLIASGTAFANGRAPATSTINFQRNNESHIAAGMTFGAVFTTDGGTTWSWMCEEAVGYGGMYDPDYAFTTSGALFATTFDGLKENADGCTYNPSSISPAAPAIKFFSSITVSQADGALFAAAADSADDKIYKSTDDGATFPTAVVPTGAQINDWYQSIEVAPSDGNVVYITGYRLINGQPKQFLLWRSSNGGTSYTQLPGFGTSGDVNGITTMANSSIEIAGISKTNPNLLYVRVTLSDNVSSSALYRSRDGGQNWDKMLEKGANLAFVARGNGQLVAATQAFGSFVATDDGSATVPTFTDLAGAPHINCLAENSAGEVWACTQNYATGTPTDGFGIMKTTDLSTWTGVLKFQDLQAPVTCADGTVQKDRCDAELWCGLCAQLGCDPGRQCAGATDAPPSGDVTQTEPGGCCQTGDGQLPGLMLVGLAASVVLLRRRRRR